ncbi:MAG: type II toxin-antitoxin system RelE/ParE family toxin [Gulosibacter sp.]|uniref:type II toxin-antitoxin system RelE/ParE family toxin n=1 Tax=Gulosibacter sp. TaxID=2817531 RepID=UPI003F915B7B
MNIVRANQNWNPFAHITLRTVGRLDPRIHKTANRKLHLLDTATTLDALRVPPGNRLEVLKGDRAGQHGIRVNDQWRICFRWADAGVLDVEIVDYH